MGRITTILFDFGGVLAEEGFSHGLESLAQEQALQVENMTAAGMQAVYDCGFVLGTGSEEAFWSLLRQRTGLQGTDAQLTRRILDGFILRPRMMALVKQLRQSGYVTGILSDQTHWLDQLDARDHFYQHFDPVYNSYYLGKGKRDPSLFADVAKNLEVPAAAILFVDDNIENVKRARDAGMQAIHYVGQAQFEQALNDTLKL